ncbi:hypothetical protein CHUAL_009324 [Chamberlinius hualienensis]
MATSIFNAVGMHDETSSQVKTPSNRIIIFIVYTSLLLDNILLTVVVPIIPDYLYNLEHADKINQTCSVGNCQEDRNLNMSTSVISTGKTYKPTKFPDNTLCSCAGSDHNVNTTDNVTLPLNLTSYYTSRYIPQDIINENAKVGLLFSSKAFVQLITNSFIGMVICRVGYIIPLVSGNICMTISSVVFACSSSYGWLFFARSLQGIGSSCIAVAGLGMIADRYSDDKERSKVMGIALGGIAMGVLVGYPFGGILYDFVGKAAPFYIITCLSFINGAFQLWKLKLEVRSEKYAAVTSSKNILKDPDVLIITGSVWVSTSALAVLEPCLPIWLMDNIAPEKWQLGTVFIPDSIGYLIGTTFFGVVSYRIGRWLMALLSLLVVGISALLVTTATQMMHLIVPHFLLGFGIGVIDSSLMPMLAMIFDTRYAAQYGTVYAIAQTAVSLAYFIGPLLGSQVVKQLGFPWLMRTIGVINIAYSPLCVYLQRNTTQLEENQAIVLSSGDLVRYNTEYPQLFSRRPTYSDKYTRFNGDPYDSD